MDEPDKPKPLLDVATSPRSKYATYVYVERWQLGVILWRGDHEAWNIENWPSKTMMVQMSWIDTWRQENDAVLCMRERTGWMGRLYDSHRRITCG